MHLINLSAPFASRIRRPAINIIHCVFSNKFTVFFLLYYDNDFTNSLSAIVFIAVVFPAKALPSIHALTG